MAAAAVAVNNEVAYGADVVFTDTESHLTVHNLP